MLIVIGSIFLIAAGNDEIIHSVCDNKVHKEKEEQFDVRVAGLIWIKMMHLSNIHSMKYILNNLLIYSHKGSKNSFRYSQITWQITHHQFCSLL